MSPSSMITVFNNKIQKKAAFKHIPELMWGKNVSFHMGFQSDMLISWAWISFKLVCLMFPSFPEFALNRYVQQEIKKGETVSLRHLQIMKKILHRPIWRTKTEKATLNFFEFYFLNGIEGNTIICNSYNFIMKYFWLHNKYLPCLNVLRVSLHSPPTHTISIQGNSLAKFLAAPLGK